MKKILALLTVAACCSVGSVYALYSVAEEGLWPKTWPAELESLRKQARTLEGPIVPLLHYEIRFNSREQFESAWPHILKLKTKEAPLFLLAAPNHQLGTTLEAGVRVHCPPKNSKEPEAPIKGVTNLRERWMNATSIDLIVDGHIVDLNRIQIPSDTPIIDERFKERQAPAAAKP